MRPGTRKGCHYISTCHIKRPGTRKGCHYISTCHIKRPGTRKGCHYISTCHIKLDRLIGINRRYGEVYPGSKRRPTEKMIGATNDDAPEATCTHRRLPLHHS